MERTLTFELEKDTKNTYRFLEVAKGAPPVIGTLYIQKWLFETAPTTISVTISGGAHGVPRLPEMLLVTRIR